MERVVSLLPSSTEIVCGLELESSLVGRSHECDFPPTVKRLPVCTEPKFFNDTATTEIYTRVKELVRNGLSIYRVDAERLKELHPDVILTQEQCEVCAVTPRDLSKALAEWIGIQPRVVSLEPATLADVFGDIGRVADALGVEDQGRALVAELTDRVTAIGERSARLPRRTVVCIEWLDPPMADGNWVPELVALAGGHSRLGRAGKHSSWVSLEQIRSAEPEVLVLLPCGFDLARTRSEVHCLTEKPGFSELRAVQQGRVALTDGNQYFNRPGPRLVESLEILAEILHPKHFDFGHRGRGWDWLAAL
jgi:iron complex transport system substrate-binding protein